MNAWRWWSGVIEKYQSWFFFKRKKFSCWSTFTNYIVWKKKKKILSKDLLFCFKESIFPLGFCVPYIYIFFLISRKNSIKWVDFFFLIDSSRSKWTNRDLKRCWSRIVCHVVFFCSKPRETANDDFKSIVILI